ncbi:hypothetical protein [Bifidobacterium panos]|uniref:Uncharacterized protein n=1 Tax=Bifidobacterium panos TaxID=2675321 RepID=A0ABX1T174_9BIFI|nr:hypothetical protein [Bifidobacterium sp. DSM 109963]NMN02756.1 hypothetical protein [Bifidobacterium sp. DSM 109963]
MTEKNGHDTAKNGRKHSVIGSLAVLTLILAVLKLTGTVSCPWWLILTPIWAPLAFIIGLLAVCWLSDAILDHFGSE